MTGRDSFSHSFVRSFTTAFCSHTTLMNRSVLRLPVSVKRECRIAFRSFAKKVSSRSYRKCDTLVDGKCLTPRSANFRPELQNNETRCQAAGKTREPSTAEERRWGQQSVCEGSSSYKGHSISGVGKTFAVHPSVYTGCGPTCNLFDGYRKLFVG